MDSGHDFTWLKRFWLASAVALALLAGLALTVGLLTHIGLFISGAMALAMFGLSLTVVRLRVGRGHEVRLLVVASFGLYAFMLALLPVVPELAPTIVPVALVPVFVAMPHLPPRSLSRYSAAVLTFCFAYALVAFALAHEGHVRLVEEMEATAGGGTDALARGQFGEHIGRMDVAFGAQLLGVIIVVAIILTLLMRNSVANRYAHHRALHDSLTGLANRALFMDRVRRALARSMRRGATVAVIFLDVDAFKSINDGHGHGFGDEVLRCVARRINESTRASDTTARVGGDEFAVLLEDVEDQSEARAVTERLRSRLAHPLEMPHGDISVRVSMGVAFGEGAGMTPDALVRSADDAMYESKRQGQGKPVTYRRATTAAPAERREVTPGFRSVVEGNGLRASSSR